MTLLVRVIVSILLLPILPLMVFLAPTWAFHLGVLLISAWCVFELTSRFAAKRRLAVYATVFAALVVFFETELISYLHHIEFIFILDMGIDVYYYLIPAFTILLFAESIIAHEKIKFSQAAVVLLAAMLIPQLFASLSLLLIIHGETFVFLPFVASICSDVSSYFFGSKLGKTRPKFLSVSPKKTLEGCIGGIAGALLGMMIYGGIVTFINHNPFELEFMQIDVWYDVNFALLALYGLIGGLAAQIGDLAMSLAKRELNIKDFSKILPGHGGLLDRFDSVLFAAPVIEFLANVLPAL